MSYRHSYNDRKRGSPRHHRHASADYDIAIPTIPSTKTVITYALVFTLAAYIILRRSGILNVYSPLQLLWAILVYITPPTFVTALEKQGSSDVSVEADEQGSYATSRTFAAKSEAMGRLFGFDGYGFLSGLQRSRRFSSLGSALGSSFRGKPLPGLGNWDNSCYQNSVIQGLASLRSISAYLERTCNIAQRQQTTSSTSEALRGIIEQLNDPKNSGRRIWTPTALKKMSSWQQQDAQEYYSKVLDELEKEASGVLKVQSKSMGLFSLADQSLKDTPGGKVINEAGKEFKKLATVFQSPLEGLLAQRVGCLKCGYVEGISMIPFNCMTLPIGTQWSYSLESCLDDYSKLELISDVECASCTLHSQREQLERLLGTRSITTSSEDSSPQLELVYNAAEARLEAIKLALESADFSEDTLSKKCIIPPRSRVSSTKSRQAVIARTPKSLALHVNRSIFDELSGVQRKNYAEVHFPKVLDLSPWCLGHVHEINESQSGSANLEQWELDPAKSMIEGLQYADTDASEESAQTSEMPSRITRGKGSTSKNYYHLQAVVAHYGRHENGHYITYRRDLHTIPSHGPEEDAETTTWWRLSDDDVAPVSEDSVLNQGGVFMLFYERIDATGSAFLAVPETAASDNASRSESEKPVDGGKVEPSQPYEVDPRTFSEEPATVRQSVPLDDPPSTQSSEAEKTKVATEHTEAMKRLGEAQSDSITSQSEERRPIPHILATGSNQEHTTKHLSGTGAGMVEAA